MDNWRLAKLFSDELERVCAVLRYVCAIAVISNFAWSINTEQKSQTIVGALNAGFSIAARKSKHTPYPRIDKH